MRIGWRVAGVTAARRIIGGARLATGSRKHGVTAVRTVSVEITIAVHEMRAAVTGRRFATVRRGAQRADVLNAQRTRQTAKVDRLWRRRRVRGRMVGLLMVMVLLLLLLALNILRTSIATAACPKNLALGKSACLDYNIICGTLTQRVRRSSPASGPADSASAD